MKLNTGKNIVNRLYQLIGMLNVGVSKVLSQLKSIQRMRILYLKLYVIPTDCSGLPSLFDGIM